MARVPLVIVWMRSLDERVGRERRSMCHGKECDKIVFLKMTSSFAVVVDVFPLVPSFITDVRRHRERRQFQWRSNRSSCRAPGSRSFRRLRIERPSGCCRR